MTKAQKTVTEMIGRIDSSAIVELGRDGIIVTPSTIGTVDALLELADIIDDMMIGIMLTVR